MYFNNSVNIFLYNEKFAEKTAKPQKIRKAIEKYFN